MAKLLKKPARKIIQRGIYKVISEEDIRRYQLDPFFFIPTRLLWSNFIDEKCGKKRPEVSNG